MSIFIREYKDSRYELKPSYSLRNIVFFRHRKFFRGCFEFYRKIFLYKVDDYLKFGLSGYFPTPKNFDIPTTCLIISSNFPCKKSIIVKNFHIRGSWLVLQFLFQKYRISKSFNIKKVFSQFFIEFFNKKIE